MAVECPCPWRTCDPHSHQRLRVDAPWQCFAHEHEESHHPFLIGPGCEWHHEWETCAACGALDKPDDPDHHLRHEGPCRKENHRGEEQAPDQGRQAGRDDDPDVHHEA